MISNPPAENAVPNWSAFELRAGDNFTGAMPYDPANPLTNAAIIQNGTTYWVGQDNLKLGIRIIGNAVAAVPEPATLLLLGTGLIGLAGLRRKRNISD